MRSGGSDCLIRCIRTTNDDYRSLQRNNRLPCCLAPRRRGNPWRRSSGMDRTPDRRPAICRGLDLVAFSSAARHCHVWATPLLNGDSRKSELQRGPSGNRLGGQNSPLSDTESRTSGSSLRTLFTWVLTARLSKGPS